MAVALALAIGSQAAASKSKDDGLVWWVFAEVEISPEGRITSLQWKGGDDVEKRVAADIEPRVLAWRFEPGTIDGVAHATTTHLAVRLRGEPQGDVVAIHIDHASTGARSAKQAHPVYPPAAIRAGADAVVTADVAIDEAGRITVEAIEYRGNRAAFRTHFVEATKAAIGQWSFTPERVGGRALATRMQIPFSYCVTRLDCEKKYQRPPKSDGLDRIGPPGQAVALESAVRLLDTLDSETL